MWSDLSRIEILSCKVALSYYNNFNFKAIKYVDCFIIPFIKIKYPS